MNTDTTLVGVRAVTASRGSLNTSVSQQWFSRPDDQKFLSMDALISSLHDRTDLSRTNTFESKKLRVSANPDDNHTLLLERDGGAQMQMTHWAFGQLCTWTQSPAAYLRKIPAFLSGLCLQHGLVKSPAEVLKLFWQEDQAGGPDQLRAATSPGYGRILDLDVARAINERLDESWKVPGVIDWGRMTYNPNVDVTKATTTLYASDRDVFIFLCRDQFPIEVGKLPDGQPDLLFPGIIVSNSETGSRALNIQTMYLRAVCQNRCLWGTENHKSITIRHTSGAPDRFIHEVQPQIESFAHTAANAVTSKVIDAKATVVAKDDDQRFEFLHKKLGLPKPTTKDIIETVLREEGHPMTSIWDVVQGMTAHARTIPYQDERVAFERRAGDLMAKA
jgi:hypothetical protein